MITPSSPESFLHFYEALLHPKVAQNLVEQGLSVPISSDTTIILVSFIQIFEDGKDEEGSSIHECPARSKHEFLRVICQVESVRSNLAKESSRIGTLLYMQIADIFWLEFKEFVELAISHLDWVIAQSCHKQIRTAIVHGIHRSIHGV